MSTLLTIIISFAIVAGLLIFYFFLARVYYVHVRNKGYSDPLIALVIPAVVILALLVGLVALVVSHRTDDNASVALFLALPVVAATAAIYFGARMLPPNRRVAGARKVRFPWSATGWSALILGVGQFLYFAFFSRWKGTLSASGKLLFFIAIPASYFCFHIAKRVRAPSADDVVGRDRRAPVLYLRAFVFEEEFFLYLRPWEASRYSSYSHNRYGATFEQYFSAALCNSIGPLVALGNPLDYAPPEGAARTYERDNRWKRRFLDLARSARCILIQVGDSRNLAWELRTLKREGLHKKTFIFIRPQEKSGAYDRWARWNLRQIQRIKGVKATSWSEFATGLRNAGYTIDGTSPLPGTVVGFNRNGKAVSLATGAQGPEDYVQVVMERLHVPCRVGRVL